MFNSQQQQKQQQIVINLEKCINNDGLNFVKRIAMQEFLWQTRTNLKT